jgi:hypothetical protein
MLIDFVSQFWQNPRMTGVPEATSPETMSRRYPTFDPEDVDNVAAAVVAVGCSDDGGGSGCGVDEIAQNHTRKEAAIATAVAEKEAEAAVVAVVAEKEAMLLRDQQQLREQAQTHHRLQVGTHIVSDLQYL